MDSMFKKVNWSGQQRLALTATQVVAALAKLDGWRLHGEAAHVAIEKTFVFDNFDETMAFVNGVALIAKRQDHHPELLVSYKHCTVRFNTHDVGGVSSTDIDCAAQVDALLS
ncbi:MAG: 4a-hydroxytetrahydrobiopterin dehydratase [Rubrivivax sp.]|nr:4a-hydroxytetrahydrobiopterin dehydratase [Rubrivivax sp.]